MSNDKVDIIVLDGVTKRFPGVIANDSVDLTIRSGEVHVLLGENGAGKSTLIDMLSGVQQPDAGTIRIAGEPTRITSPRHALSLGIGTVFQHTMLVPSLTVAENLLLGGPWWQNPKKSELRTQVDAISRNLGLAIDLDAEVSGLSLGQQQQIEILRALLRNSRVLILDESTSMLTPKGIEELGVLVRKLAGRGLAIIFITHKLKEAVSFGDRISVLKLGRKVGEVPPERLKSQIEASIVSEIVEMMFGRKTGDPEAAVRSPRLASGQKPLLEVREIDVSPTAGNPGLRSVSFDVEAGEVLGIAGIDGNGQKQLADALAGQISTRSGSIRIEGKELNGLSAGERRTAGLRYLTDDRLGEGTVGAFPVAINFFLKEIGRAPLWKRGIEQRSAITARADAMIKQYDVRTPGVHTPVGRLSGGNIQKLILAREMADGAKVVIFNKPTYGLDLANTLATRIRIGEIAKSGMAVLLISTDLEELLALSDRIAVMSGGSLAGLVENSKTARTDVGSLMVGLAA